MMNQCCGFNDYCCGEKQEKDACSELCEKFIKEFKELNAIRFEPVKRVVEEGIHYHLPERKTKGSAGYDIEAIEDIIIPSKTKLMCELNQKLEDREYTLTELGNLTKGYRPTIVRTGMKIKMPEDCVCLLAARSSTGLKYGLRIANIFPIIDSDYYSNIENDGEIGFIFENTLPVDIKIKKGEIIGQALIVKRENVTDEQAIWTTRTGGYGSTSK